MAKAASSAAAETWPGQQIGLPATGRGSLATWMTRITALVLDWAASMAVAVGAFGVGVLTEQTWRAWMIMAVFFVESAVLSALAGGSFGQLICRIGIIRMDGQPLGFLRAIPRAAMVCLVIPALVVDGNRRGLHDLTVGTVVVNRR